MPPPLRASDPAISSTRETLPAQPIEAADPHPRPTLLQSSDLAPKTAHDCYKLAISCGRSSSLSEPAALMMPVKASAALRPNRSDLRGRAMALAAQQHGVITRSEALEIGLTQRAIGTLIRSGEWERVRQGVYRVSSSPPSWRQQLMVAVLICGPSAAASHRAAGCLLKLDGVPGGFVEVTVTTPGKSPPTGLILHHSRDLPSSDLTSIDGISTTTVERTLVDLGAVCSDAVVETALEDAFRRRLTTHLKLSRRLEELQAKGRRGPPMLHRLMSLRTTDQPPTESKLEERLLRLLRKSGLPEPERQFLVSENRRPIARLDFAYPEEKIAIECDGFRYHSGRERFDSDRDRRNVLVSRGWRIVSVTSSDLDRRPGRLVKLLRLLLVT